MRCDQAQELITARVDNELGAAERAAIDSHLQSCADCRRTYGQEQFLKRQVQLAARTVIAPAALRQSVERKNHPAASVENRSFAQRIFDWCAVAAWRPALAAALLLVTVGTYFYAQRGADNIGAAAIETHRSILSGRTTLARYDNAAALRSQLARAVGDRFQPVALDLSLLQLYPVSGFVHKIAGRDVLVTVYQGAGPAITCFTFLGSAADAPQGADQFYDTDMKLNFYSFSRDDINGILHQEGSVICVLVSKMVPADLLALLRGKSAHA